MRPILFMIVIGMFIISCTHMTRLSEEDIAGEKVHIFVRPFSAVQSPPEVAKLVSDRFYTILENEKFFKGREGRTYSFDFYLGQKCPDGNTCYYITGEVKDYQFKEGCCEHDGVEVSSMIRFQNDLTQKPLFEISEFNNEVFVKDELDQLQAIELLADDSASTLVEALLKELSKN